MSLKVIHFFACSFLVALLIGCSRQESKKEVTLFSEMPADSTGINFINQLSFDQKFNVYTYRNFYNGGGVAIGDINNDGLPDIYFTANMTSNRLYLNKGNFKFEDITEKAGVSGKHPWSTGVSLADVNGDGWLDLYVCSSGKVEGDPEKHNELFINNKDLTFTERSAEYGVDDRGYSTHAAFFDYDRDGDLDLYVLNNSYQAIGSFNLRKNERSKRDSLGGHKLYRNDGNRFTDVSESAGIYGSVIAFGLGVTVGDVNNDGWQDIYVSNDFFERDYLYINNQDGTFIESLTDAIKSISGASMGADLADVNNDSKPDLFVTEMLPKENHRIKTVTTFEDWNRYQYNVANDYYHQFTRNTFQLNNGDGTFSEIGRLSGVEATDWSWGALIFDMDNDGMKDIFVANGILQDLTNQDFLQFAINEEFVKSVISKNNVDYKKLTEIIPSNKVSNYAYHNSGGLQFENRASEWGLSSESFSNGSAYGDLDNDGDLDLVVNNVNMPCFVYRNETSVLFPDHHYLKINLQGEQKNTYALGAKIIATVQGETIYLEQMPMRGFESSVDPRPNLGLGKHTVVDKLTVLWPDGRITEMDSVQVNQTLTLKQSDGKALQPSTKKESPVALFREDSSRGFIDYHQQENSFVDFDRESLLYHMVSREGPRMSKGDVNGDSLEDFYIGGPKDQAGALYVQGPAGKFSRKSQYVFDNDKISEDMGSVFFDADNDGDHDLYVCSGGNEFPSTSSALIDRLYINDGKGNFHKSDQVLPTGKFESTSTVKASDYDGDGDVDLFVGVRLRSFSYGIGMNGYILANDGKGNFRDVSREIAPGLKGVGMITDAVWSDVDRDGDDDLLVVGEYMPVKVLINTGGKFHDQTEKYGLNKSHGWWNRIEEADLDDDGDTDFVLGNHGLNSRFKASDEQPVLMFVNDFDLNGTVEQIICTYNGGKSYPMVLRHDLLSQIPSLKKKYLKYESYKDQTINDIFTPEQMEGAVKSEVYTLANSILINEGNGKMRLEPLPAEAQLSPVYGIEIADIDGDGTKDIFMGGNLYGVKPEAGRYDASYGLLLKGDGHMSFKPLTSKQSGIRIDGEIRDIITLRTRGQELFLISRNNNSVVLLKLSR
ncbi:MAG: VCBS repeat-containing protein [Cyclobacteriaceae bacterium]